MVGVGCGWGSYIMGGTAQIGVARWGMVVVCVDNRWMPGNVMGVGRDGMGCVVGWGNGDAFHCTVGRLMLWCDWADIFMNVNLVCDLTK